MLLGPPVSGSALCRLGVFLHCLGKTKLTLTTGWDFWYRLGRGRLTRCPLINGTETNSTVLLQMVRTVSLLAP